MPRGLRLPWRRWFQRKQRLAARILTETGHAESTADAADNKARHVRVGKFRQAFGDVQVLSRLVRAWARGDYREVSRATIGLVLGALVYFVSPIDAILDSLPLAGYIDDAAILAWVLSEVRSEIDAFRQWESSARELPALPPANERQSLPS